MILHFTKHPDGNITTSNYPINENGIDSVPFEVSQEDKKAVAEGTHDWDIQGDQLNVTVSDRKEKLEQAKLNAVAQAEAAKLKKLELVEKVTAGTATKQEQTEFVNLL